MRKQIIDNVDIELPEFDANELNSLMYEMVEAFVYALGHQSNRKTKVESSELLKALLRVFVVTHKSMLLLLHRELSDPLMAADAISLVREQVEKVYVLSLIVDDEQKWTRQYFRSNWRFRYERFLRTQSDHGGKPRFQEFLTSYPRILDQGRYVPVESGPKPQVLVTRLMARCVKYRFNNPDAPKQKWPSYFSKKKFDEYFMFPTPGKAIRYVQNKSAQRFLSTWYKEYQWLSRYSHIAVDKVFLNAISQSKNAYSAEKFDSERERRMEDAAMVSYLAVASACAEVSKKLSNDFGAVRQLLDFWDTLRKSSLDGRKLWDVYISSLLQAQRGVQ